MARRTFFSFHYSEDCWRASQVRSSWVTQDREAAGFFDSAAWQEVKKKSESVIANWIDLQMHGTSVTVVLIGSNTAGRKWINYEIESSRKRGNGMLGIYIHNNKDKDGRVSSKGRNPIDEIYITVNNQRMPYSSLYNTYDWVNNNGYNNMGTWIEVAAKASGK